MVGFDIFVVENRIPSSIPRLRGSKLNLEPRNLEIDLEIRFSNKKIWFPTTISEIRPRNQNLNPILKIGFKFRFRGPVSKIVVGNLIFRSVLGSILVKKKYDLQF